MSSVLRVSDAATLALHTAVLLADRTDGPLTTKEIASTFVISEAHLAKVLQRLAKAGIVSSGRGPKGGFVLGKRADRTTLLEVYEAIEGPLTDSDCLLGVPICGGSNCILGRLIKNLNAQVRECLSNTRLSETTSAFKNLALYDRIMRARALQEPDDMVPKGRPDLRSAVPRPARSAARRDGGIRRGTPCSGRS